MTKKTGLTRADYVERHASLEAHLSEARSARAQAAYRLEMGEGDKKAVDEAAANITELESRISDLDAAWEIVQKNDAARLAAEEVKGRTDALRAIDEALDARAEAHRELAKGLDELARVVASIEAADAKIVEVAKPWLGPRELGDLRAEISSGYSRIRDRIVYAGNPCTHHRSTAARSLHSLPANAQPSRR